MAHIHFSLPPELLPGGDAEFWLKSQTLGPCLMCLMFAKGDQVDATEDQWNASSTAARDKSDREYWIPYPPAAGQIREAVCVGISDMMAGLPLMPLCWDHLGALRRAPDPGTQKHIRPERSLPPGLNGSGGHFR